MRGYETVELSKNKGNLFAVQTDISFYIICAFGVLLAAISKAGFGSKVAFAASAILATVIDPGQAIGIMLPLLLLMDVGSLRPYWRKWDMRITIVLLSGAVVGIALGASFYRAVDADVFRVMLGLLTLAFVGYQALQSVNWIRPQGKGFGPIWGVVAGCVAGFTSFVSHAGGPPAAVYMLSHSMRKTTYQATTVIVFFIVNVLKFIPYAWLGLFTWETVKIDMIMAPFALLGVWIGVRAHHWMSERFFFTVTYILLVCTGLRLLWVGLT